MSSTSITEFKTPEASGLETSGQEEHPAKTLPGSPTSTAAQTKLPRTRTSSNSSEASTSSRGKLTATVVASHAPKFLDEKPKGSKNILPHNDNNSDDDRSVKAGSQVSRASKRRRSAESYENYERDHAGKVKLVGGGRRKTAIPLNKSLSTVDRAQIAVNVAKRSALLQKYVQDQELQEKTRRTSMNQMTTIEMGHVVDLSGSGKSFNNPVLASVRQSPPQESEFSHYVRKSVVNSLDLGNATTSKGRLTMTDCGKVKKEDKDRERDKDKDKEKERRDADRDGALDSSNKSLVTRVRQHTVKAKSRIRNTKASVIRKAEKGKSVVADTYKTATGERGNLNWYNRYFHAFIILLIISIVMMILASNQYLQKFCVEKIFLLAEGTTYGWDSGSANKMRKKSTSLILVDSKSPLASSTSGKIHASL